MRIGGFDTGERILLVAELGNNHEGRPEVARELVQRAAEAGAGAVKLQTFEPRLFVRRGDRARFEQLSAFRLDHGAVEELRGLAAELGLLFISTPLDLESAAFLEPLVDAFKIASGDNDFTPLLKRVAETGRPVIVSAGLLDLEGTRATKDLIEACWRRSAVEQELAILHCVTAYPAPAEELNLAAVALLIEELDCTVGYSDHALGIDACVVAASLGARIIEKHFTLDHEFSGFRDHQLSAEPDELSRLAGLLAAGPEALEAAAGSCPASPVMTGRREKAMQPSERELAGAVRRSIVAAADLPRGHRLQSADLTWLRPRDGLAPGHEPELLDRMLLRDVASGEPILTTDVE